MKSRMNDEWPFSYSTEQEDICPFCCMNLFPIYSAGIDSRERHVARHMENVALSVLQQDDDIITATELSDHTQSDGQSIGSWSSGSSSSLGEGSNFSDRNDFLESYREDSDISSSPERGALRMDMTDLRGGNDEMLSVYP